MSYVRPDKDVLLSGIESFTARLKSAGSAQEQIALLQEHNRLLDQFQTMAALAYVRNTIDTRDAYYDAEREYNDNLEPLVNEKEQEFNRALLESPYRAELERELGTLLFQNTELEQKAFSPEIIPPMQEESQLCAQYQKLYASAQIPFEGETLTIAQLTPYKQHPDRAVRKTAYEAEGSWFDAHRAEFDEIFDKLVKNRTEQARKLGFSSFIELGYIRRKRNCYGPEGVANFRRQVIEDLVPVVQEIKQAQARRIGVSDFKFYDDAYVFPDGNPVPQGTPEEIMAAGRQMYTEMSPETAAFIRMMSEQDLFDVLAKEGKAPGGYCTSLPDYGCPFIFSNFNGTSHDVDVLTHEAGHAFAFFEARKAGILSQLMEPSMEGCETHSMSMEFLTEPWHHLFFGPQTAKYELYHAEDALIIIPYGSEIDHFQELCYAHPEMTPDERNAAWAELEQKYRPYIDHEGMPFYGRGAGWQRQLHVYLYPFYYIDYCMAQTIALQFWADSLQDRKRAWERYLAFVRMGGTKTFVDLVKSVELRSPLEDGALRQITQTVVPWLQEHQI